MSRVTVTLAAALILGVAAIGVTLAKSPAAVAGANGAGKQVFYVTRHTTATCQQETSVPRGTNALRLHFYAGIGPRVTAELSIAGRVIASGEREAGWSGEVVTVPVKTLVATDRDATLCTKLYLDNAGTGAFIGTAAPGAQPRLHSGRLPGRMLVEYMKPGPRSWWSLARQVARRVGIGHAAAGTWSTLLVVLVMVAVLAMCSTLVLRELR